ncbi:MAG: signal peptide peptidase SppA [Bacteroidales bacterium]|nr:signal peptide peptidase SppA [Bacteroidales bacterium]
MKDFLKMTGAVLLGLFVWGCITSLFSLLFFVMMIASLSSKDTNTTTSVESHSVLQLNLCDAIDDRTTTDYSSIYNSFSFDDMERLGLNDISRSIYSAATDDNIMGLCINCSNYNVADIATADALRRLIVEFKELSGKPVYAFSNSFHNLDYYIATACDSIFMRTFGEFALNGLCSQSMFYKNALDKFGIDAQVMRHGKFKAAVEPFLQDKMSDDNRQQINAYLTDIWNCVASAITETRDIQRETIDQLVNTLDLYGRDEKCIQEGFIDGVILESDFDDIVVADMNSEDEDGNPKYITVSEYVETLTDTDSDGYSNSIAVLYAGGEIVEENDGEVCITSDDLVSDIEKAMDDEDVKAVVLRVNSPGGSAVEAEIIYNALLKLKEEKPIVVSMGGYAASGGYYISSCANKIYAEPNTITGSIGVFGLVLSPEKLLTNTLGINVETVKTHEMSDLYATMSPLSTEELAVMQREVERVYDVFLQHVADGRNMTKEQVDEIAQGRVWTGTSALKIGLVDELGGLEDAINYAAELANVEDGYNVKEFPEEEDDEFMKIFSQLSKGAAKLWYGEDVYAQTQMVKKIKSHKGVQALMPKTIIK